MGVHVKIMLCNCCVLCSNPQTSLGMGQKLNVLGPWRNECSVRGAEEAVQLSRLEQESRNF